MAGDTCGEQRNIDLCESNNGNVLKGGLGIPVARLNVAKCQSGKRVEAWQGGGAEGGIGTSTQGFETEAACRGPQRKPMLSRLPIHKSNAGNMNGRPKKSEKRQCSHSSSEGQRAQYTNPFLRCHFVDAKQWLQPLPINAALQQNHYKKR